MAADFVSGCRTGWHPVPDSQSHSSWASLTGFKPVLQLFQISRRVPCTLHKGTGYPEKSTRILSLVTTLFVCLIAPGFADQLPPPPVLTPEQQQKTFRFAEPGYRIELVASDPMIQDPVAIKFDGQGRLWVVEMRGYMRDIERTDLKKPDGRISVLEDTDGDGIMDKSTVFLNDLILPRAIAIYPDGVLVAENRALWFAEDLDGDLVSDRETLVDGFYARDNIEHSANGLLQAMDNWIYNAKEGKRYRRTGKRWIKEKTEARGQWGICQDNEGRLFYNYNHSQLHTDLVPPNFLTRNRNHKPLTGINVGVSTTNRVFPIRPNPASNRGYIPGVLDDQGRIKEFTSACSPLIYRESLFEEFADNSFVCETVGNLIKRSQLSRDGLSISATEVYPDRDFLASTDERFRPCGIETGPDGAIYIVDMYRGIVQDAPHMSPWLRQISIDRKMETPVHLGRIWRIVPDKPIEQPERPRFHHLNDSGLVSLLAHPSGWWRDKAQLHLVHRASEKSVPLLKAMALEHENELARLHALWTLEGLGLESVESLNDNSSIVKAAAMRTSTNLPPPEKSMTDSVRLQYLLSLGEAATPAEKRIERLCQLISPVIDSPLMRDALLSSIPNLELPWLRHYLNTDIEKTKSPGSAILIETVTAAILKDEKKTELEALLKTLPDSWPRRTITSTIKRYTPAPEKQKNIKPLTKQQRKDFMRGRQIYLTTCAGCHGNDGKGMRFIAPPLAGSDWVQGSQAKLAMILFHGLTGPITVTGKTYTAPEVQPTMPPLANLNNADTAAVLTYIRREWGNTAAPVSKDDVVHLRIRAQGRTTPWTEPELEPAAKIVEAQMDLYRKEKQKKKDSKK